MPTSYSRKKQKKDRKIKNWPKSHQLQNKTKKERGRTRSWTEDLLICSQMLYHWAIRPSLDNSRCKKLPFYCMRTAGATLEVLWWVVASWASCHPTSKGKKREWASSCVHNQKITKTEWSCKMSIQLRIHSHVGLRCWRQLQRIWYEILCACL